MLDNSGLTPFAVEDLTDTNGNNLKGSPFSIFGDETDGDSYNMIYVSILDMLFKQRIRE
jgi:hypothetical protein